MCLLHLHSCFYLIQNPAESLFILFIPVFLFYYAQHFANIEQPEFEISGHKTKAALQPASLAYWRPSSERRVKVRVCTALKRPCNNNNNSSSDDAVILNGTALRDKLWLEACQGLYTRTRTNSQARAHTQAWTCALTGTGG